MTYEDNLRKHAEELAKRDEIKQWGYDRFENFDKETKESVISEYYHLAVYVLEKQAEAYKEGWNMCYEEMRERDNDFPMSGLDTPREDKSPDYYLLTAGYTPDKK